MRGVLICLSADGCGTQRRRRLACEELNGCAYDLRKRAVDTEDRFVRCGWRADRGAVVENSETQTHWTNNTATPKCKARALSPDDSVDTDDFSVLRDSYEI